MDMNLPPLPQLTGHLEGLQEHNRLIADLDLADYEDVTTGKLVIVHPVTKAPTSSWVTLAGPEHPARKQLEMARTRRVRAEFATTGKMPITDPVDEYAEQTDYLVSVTLGWGLAQGGQPLAFNADTARAVFTDPKRQWFRTQVQIGLQKTELFIASSAKA